MCISWPKVISDTKLWKAIGEKPITLQTGMRNTLRKVNESVEKQASDWNLQEGRRRGRLKKTWKRTTFEEVRKCGKTWSKVKSLVGNTVGWRCLKNALCS
jgi:hypothetical protein